jgi:hypothetical protein
MAAKPLLTSTFVVSCCTLLSRRFRRVAAPARPTQAVSGPTVGLGSVLDSRSNLCSIPWIGGDLARPGPGPADRGTAGAVRGAAWRRPGHRARAGRQGRLSTRMSAPTAPESGASCSLSGSSGPRHTAGAGAATSTADGSRPQMCRVHALARASLGSSASWNPDCPTVAASRTALSRRRFSRWYCARAQLLEQ